MKHAIFAICLLAIVSCKDSKNQEKEINTDAVEATHEDYIEKASNVYANSWIKEIETNEDGKWEANAETNEGVQKMQNNIKTHITNTLDAYHKLAEQLNDDKNYVIKNCTMKGAPHDNLHVWLMPLMEKIEALSESKTVEEASKLKESIVENVNAYSNYFE
jgi:energy-converting hydrogenase A subunit M